jgi:cell division control protein 24
LIGCFK